MNTQHLSAFLWLHFTLRKNQLTRGGVVNMIFLAMFAVGVAVVSVGLFFGGIALGMFALSAAKEEHRPTIVLFVWDGIVFFFFVWWGIGLLQELQRSEALSLDKFLHLPVSLSGVFVLNYVSSVSSSLTLVVQVPAMVGFTLGLVYSEGPMMLLHLPALAAFVLMITALTYHFQGWLASLMINKRKRRTIGVLATMFFILIFQLPNLINVFQPWKHEKNWTQEEQQRIWEVVQQFGWFINLALPPGWLALSAMGAAEKDALPPLLGAAGMTLIGTASLWRAYRTTLRMYTGQYTAGTKPPGAEPAVVAAAPLLPIHERPIGLLETQMSWLPERAAVIALAGFRSLTRAPEAKMLLLTPIIVGFIAIAAAVYVTEELPEPVRPLLAFLGMSFMLFSLVQIMGNQFGFDRSGFRAFVLGPAPRDQILLGKNLAVAPIAMGLCLVPIALVAVVFPMRIDHFFALLPQVVSMYFLISMLWNWMAILAPTAMPSGSLKRVQPKFLTIVIQMMFVFAFPVLVSPTVLPLGLEAALEKLGWVRGVPIHLILSSLICVAVLCLYWPVLRWQGQVLHLREQRILEIVTSKAE